LPISSRWVGKSFSDQSTTGDECFQIASNDAATLGLFVKTNAYFLHPSPTY
jgi:hypothetical protein